MLLIRGYINSQPWKPPVRVLVEVDREIQNESVIIPRFFERSNLESSGNTYVRRTTRERQMSLLPMHVPIVIDYLSAN